MSKKDYYDILGVDRNADSKTIKQSYRRLAMKLHPDRNPDDPRAEAHFKEAAEAYDVLSNDEKRQIYDRYGHDGLKGNTGFSGMDDIFTHFGDIFSDFFGGDIFGGGRRASRPPRPPRGADMRIGLQISLKEAFEGVKRSLELDQKRMCSVCSGSGAKPGTEPQPCGTCQGHGQVVQRSGFMSMVTACPHCQGKGTIVTSPCKNCDGSGLETFTRSVTVNVPRGVDSGMRLRLSGEGERLTAGDPGDLYVFIEVAGDSELVREHNDLHYDARIGFTRAILGTTITVPLLVEDVSVEIPSGVQPGDIITVAGKGMPLVGKDVYGDLHVCVHVVFPADLTDEQRDLIERLDKSFE